MFIRRQILFPTIGIMPPNNIFITQIGLAEGNGAGAFYDSDRRLTIIPSTFDKEHVNDLTALVKMLTVDLLDQHFRDESAMSDDTWYAKRAVIYGKASLTADRFRFQVSKNLQRPPGSSVQALEVTEIFNALPVYVRNITQFSSIHGKEYVDLYLQNQAQVSDPKASHIGRLIKATNNTKPIIFPNRKLPKPKQVKNSPSNTDEKHTVSTQLGALGVLAHLKQSMTPAEAVSATEGYVSDELIYIDITKDENITKLDGIVIWKVTFKNNQQAEVFENHLADLTESDPASRSLKKNNSVVTLTAEITFDTKAYQLILKPLKN